METLARIRRRLDAFADLSVIVRTMKALAAVNIRQYEEATRSLAGYYRTVELGLHVMLRDGPAPPPAGAGRREGPVGAIVFGSDHGLCGRFNEEMVDYTLERLDEAAGDGRVLRLMAVGSRVASLLEQAGQTVEEDMFVPSSAERITATVRQILLKIEDWQAEAGISRIYLLHNRPVAAGRSRPIGVQLLPVDLKRFHRLEEERWPGRSLPTYSMSRDSLLSNLLRQYFFVSIFRACAESLAAENASRLAAMKAAEKSLGEKHEELRSIFRRRRQDEITGEILDVVTGYEVMTRGGAEIRDD